MQREDPLCGPSTSTATPPYPHDDRGRLHDMDGRMGRNGGGHNTMPLPPLETIAHGNSPSLPQMDPTGFKINRWQNRNFDSGVQTMVHSQTQSLMSMHPSEMSVMSGMTEDVTRQDLTEAERARFEGLTITPCGNYEGSGLPDLVEIMMENNERMVLKAVYMMQTIAKGDSNLQRERIIFGPSAAIALKEVMERWSHSQNIIKVSLMALFHLCNHPEGAKDVIELVGNDASFLAHLIKHTRTAEAFCYKYAFLTLHSILSDRSALGKAATSEARQLDAISPAVNAIRVGESEKLLPIIVDLIKILCEKSNEQKDRFIELGGVARLLEIFQRCNYEKLLFQSTQLLLRMANYSPSSLTVCSAPSILHTRLSHGSVRLVQSLLECLRSISDIPSPPNTDATPVLSSIMCLFGHPNPFVSLYCVQILSNMIANHRKNKEFLASKGIVTTLMRLMYESTYWNSTERDKEVGEEMQEAVLGCLHQLSVRHDYAQQVCAHVMADANSGLLLGRLVVMRPAVLRQTLLILVQAAPLDNNLPSFRETQLQVEDNVVTFIHQIVMILRVALYQFPNAIPGVTLKVENVKVVDLIVSTMTILTSLCRDPRLLAETVYHFQQQVNASIGDRRVFLPLFALEQPFVQDDSMTGPTLSLLLVLTSNHQILSMLQSTTWLFQLLQTHARRPEPHIATPANNLLSVLFNHSAVNHERIQPQYDNYAQYGTPSGYGGYQLPSSSHHHPPPPPSHHNHPHHPPTVPLHHVVHPSLPSSSSSSRPEPSPEGTPTHNLSGRSDILNDAPWPEDLPLETDPFAQVFCSPSTPPSPAPPAVFDAYTSQAPPPNQYPPVPPSHLQYPDPYHPSPNY